MDPIIAHYDWLVRTLIIENSVGDVPIENVLAMMDEARKV
jgi:hypothetical protein